MHFFVCKYLQSSNETQVFFLNYVYFYSFNISFFHWHSYFPVISLGNFLTFTYINTVLSWWSIRTWLSRFSLLSLKKKRVKIKTFTMPTTSHLCNKDYAKLTGGPGSPGGPLSPCRQRCDIFLLSNYL